MCEHFLAADRLLLVEGILARREGVVEGEVEMPAWERLRMTCTEWGS